MGKLNRINEFTTPYSFREALRRGGLETKLSMILAGLGNIVHKQVGKGLLFLAAEAVYVVFRLSLHCNAGESGNRGPAGNLG